MGRDQPLPEEVRRRPFLYFGTPVLAFLAGAMLYSLGSMVFWRVLAYLAVWHFVRQQYGWVALYRARLAPLAALLVPLGSFWHGNRQSIGVSGLYRGLCRAFDSTSRYLEQLRVAARGRPRPFDVEGKCVAAAAA